MSEDKPGSQLSETVIDRPRGKPAKARVASARPSATLDLGRPHSLVAATFARGEHIDRFRVASEVGSGGMGVVLKAYDPDLDRHVALKVLKPGTFQDDTSGEGRARLLREAQAMAKVVHPNVITVYSVGTTHGQVYIAMEFIEGRTLRTWLAGGERSWREVVKLFLKAGHGLQAAHDAGLVHRDFKPENVLIGNDERVLVTDFGLVREEADLGPLPRSSIEIPTAATAGASLTQTGTLLGTPPYMAPEQHRGHASDARADQFAFCVSLFEGLYGERPHAGETYSELVANVLAGRTRKPPAFASVPASLHTVIMRGLSVDPAARYDSMAALMSALGRIRSRRLRRRGSFGLGIGVGAVGVAALTVVILRAAPVLLPTTIATMQSARAEARALTSEPPDTETPERP